MATVSTSKVAVNDALKGVTKAVLIMANGEQQLTIEKQFTDCAVAAGVKHFVKLSSMESEPGTTKPIPAMHVASEDHIKASGMNWTMIRPRFFTAICSVHEFTLLLRLARHPQRSALIPLNKSAVYSPHWFRGAKSGDNLCHFCSLASSLIAVPARRTWLADRV
jgi:hypothetical protein